MTENKIRKYSLFSSEEYALQQKDIIRNSKMELRRTWRPLLSFIEKGSYYGSYKKSEVLEKISRLERAINRAEKKLKAGILKISLDIK